LVKYFEGDLVIINRDPTPYDHRADIVIHAGVGEVFSALLLELGLDL
jgi:NAD-dependent SIR2 family protein deacetylase